MTSHPTTKPAHWVPGRGWVEYDAGHPQPNDPDYTPPSGSGEGEGEEEGEGEGEPFPGECENGIPCKPESAADAQEYPLPAGTGAGGGAPQEMCCLIAPETGEFDVEPISQSEIPADWQWIEYAHAKDKTDFYIYESTQTDSDTGLKHRYFVRLLDAFEGQMPVAVTKHQRPVEGS